MNVNYYAISLDAFMEAKRHGNYPVFWCILKDRVHIEYPIENAIFMTQAFIANMKKGLGDDFDGDPIDIFIKQHIKDKIPNFRFYPTKEQLVQIRSVKLYDKLEATQVRNMNGLNPSKTKIVEDDFQIATYNDNELFMKMKKVTKE